MRWTHKMNQTDNCLRVILPYKWNGLWVVDDPLTGLTREALISGMDDILDRVAQEISPSTTRLMCVFSEMEFPGHTLEFRWVRKGGKGVGNWYYCEQFKMEGWLCPALLKYFTTPPERIFARITAKTKPRSKT